MHIGPNNKAIVTHFTICLVQRNEERGKTSRGKSSLKKGHEKQYQKCSIAGVSAAPN